VEDASSIKLMGHWPNVFFPHSPVLSLGPAAWTVGGGSAAPLPIGGAGMQWPGSKRALEGKMDEALLILKVGPPDKFEVWSYRALAASLQMR
jgi:hypothetical protein